MQSAFESQTWQARLLALTTDRTADDIAKEFILA